MQFRSVYGLGVATNRDLPGFDAFPLATHADVQFVLGALPAGSGTRADAMARPFVSTLQADDGRLELVATTLQDGAFRLDYEEGTVVVVERRGEKVWAQWPEEVGIEQAALYLLGPVMGIVHRLRGSLCLHASAVAVGDGAVAFVGVSGAGKSSTAAALARRGFPVLADDMLPVRDLGERFEVAVSPSRLKLWPDSAAAVCGPDRRLPRIAPREDKYLLEVPRSETRGPTVPLRGAYFLGRRQPDLEQARISDMPAHDAMLAIIADAFAARYQDRAGRAREFDLVSRLVSAIPLRRLQAPQDLRGLDDLARIVAADFERM